MLSGSRTLACFDQFLFRSAHFNTRSASCSFSVEIWSCSFSVVGPGFIPPNSCFHWFNSYRSPSLGSKDNFLLCVQIGVMMKDLDLGLYTHVWRVSESSEKVS
ncbi:hypothetical protein ACH5RR_000032 [Cinchona calisaya]|uniref:Uncharacterized protein n=1 Tax=Cinchona calisaya TaxID=153742 RepID=A0ABD3AZQ5_9GENT